MRTRLLTKLRSKANDRFSITFENNTYILYENNKSVYIFTRSLVQSAFKMLDEMKRDFILSEIRKRRRKW